MPLPVVPFLGQQLLELSQRYHAPFDKGAVRDRLSAEVVSDHDVLTWLGRAAAWSLLGLQPAVQKYKRPAEYQPTCQHGQARQPVSAEPGWTCRNNTQGPQEHPLL